MSTNSTNRHSPMNEKREAVKARRAAPCERRVPRLAATRSAGHSSSERWRSVLVVTNEGKQDVLDVTHRREADWSNGRQRLLLGPNLVSTAQFWGQFRLIVERIAQSEISRGGSRRATPNRGCRVPPKSATLEVRLAAPSFTPAAACARSVLRQTLAGRDRRTL